MVNLFFGKILLEGVSCCVPKKPLPMASGLLSLSRECFAKAYFWKHKVAAQRLWGWGFPHSWLWQPFHKADSASWELGLGNFGLVQIALEEHNPMEHHPVSQGILKTLEGPTLKTLCQHSNLLCYKSNKKCVQSVFPPKNQRKKRKVQGPKLTLPFSAPTRGQFLWGNTSFSTLSSITAKPNAKLCFKV